MQDYKKKNANLWEESGQIHLKNGIFISKKKKAGYKERVIAY